MHGAQLRSTAAGGHIEGHAAVFDQVAELGPWAETIKKGAFTRALKEREDVRCLFNHNADNILGRTTSNTLTLAEDAVGLRFACDLPATSYATDLKASIKRGDVTGCSFSFVVVKQAFDHASSTCSILDVDLFDVGPVTYPAYEGTDVRSRDLRGACATVGVYHARPVRADPCASLEDVGFPPTQQEIESLRRRFERLRSARVC